MNKQEFPAGAGPVDGQVGRLEPEHEDDEPGDQCLHCRGDGMDPDCDYLLPCPDCGGSW